MVKGNTADPAQFAEEMDRLGNSTEYIIPERIGCFQ
jgi:hypothetical protein